MSVLQEVMDEFETLREDLGEFGAADTEPRVITDYLSFVPVWSETIVVK